MSDLPAAVANSAAEAIRALNHLTMLPLEDGRPGWEEASDIYQVVAELESMAFRLPQLFRQLAKRLDTPPAGSRFAVDAMTDESAGEIVDRAHRRLLAASVQVDHLGDSLAAAAGAMSHLYLAEVDEGAAR